MLYKRGCPRSQQASGLAYTFIRVGEVVEGKEGGSVMVANVTDELPVEEVVRDDIVRLSAEAFLMENATDTVRYYTHAFISLLFLLFRHQPMHGQEECVGEMSHSRGRREVLIVNSCPYTLQANAARYVLAFCGIGESGACDLARGVVGRSRALCSLSLTSFASW